MVAKQIFGILTLALLTTALMASPSFQQAGNQLVMSNGDVCVQYDLDAGRAAFYWQNSNVISSFYAAVTNGNGSNLGYLSTAYASRSWGQSGANTVVVTNTGNNLPTMLQFFTFDQPDSFLTSVSLTAATNLESRWMAPLVVNTAGGVNIGSYDDDRALFVPFDNDAFVSYNSESMNGSDTGCEVGAFYDNTTRIGLVVGAVTHDVWKTGVYWSGSNDTLNQLQVFGGLSDHWTWDVMPHGLVGGKTISSPTIFVGFGNNWRATMDDFADANTNFAPRRVWTGGVPFGWNSWGVANYQSHISYSSAIAVSDSIHANLQPYGFTNNGTVYVNLDSYWNNLWTDAYGSQLSAFVAHCHANGQKAGIYYTPFAFWGNLTDATNYLVPEGWPGSYYTNFYAILLKDANGNYIHYANGNAYAIDPTNPHTKGYIDYYTSWFKYWGFDYVKLDFLSLGALEGMHYDTNVTTGIEAYNEGMQYLLHDFGTNMFISESIAPLFPYQYADSRRIACDAQQSKISNTAYTMNSVSCGWWLDRLYPFNDPDLMVFDNGPDTNEDQSRVINCAITGLFLNGSILTNASSISLAQMCLTNAAINAVARLGRTFRPVDGASGTGAAHILELQNGTTWYIAVFNYTSSATVETVDLNRAGLPAGSYIATNLWDGTSSIVSGSFNVNLNEKQAKLFELAPVAFAVSVMPSAQAIGAGHGYANYAINVAAVGGFNGNVALRLSGTPAGVTFGISPAIVIGGSGSATLSVTNSGSAPGGSYPLTITGVSGQFTNSATVKLNISQGTVLWNSGGVPDGNWTNPANWGGIAPTAGSQLTFGSGSQVLATNNFSTGVRFGNVAFTSGSPSFTLNGNTITLANPSQDALGTMSGGAIDSSSVNNQTMNLPVTLSGGSHSITTANGSGQLNLSGSLGRDPGATVQFNQSGGAINVGLALTNGIVGGWAIYSPSATLINNNGGAGTVDWATVSSGSLAAYSGYTAVSGSGQTIGNNPGANVKVTSNGSVNDTVGSGTTTINTLNWVAANQNGYIDIPANATLRFGAQGGIIQNDNKYLRIGNGQSGSVVTAGGANGSAGELCVYNLSYYSGGAVEFWTTLADNGSSSYPLSVTTFGSVNVDNPNTYSGGTYINAGDFYCNNNGNTPFGYGPVYVFPGGRADMGGDNGTTIANDFFIAGMGFVLNNQPGAIKGTYSGTFTGTITLTGNAWIDPNAGSATCTFNGPFTGTGSLSFGGPVGYYVGGMAVLSGDCNYTGDTIVDATVGSGGNSGCFVTMKIAANANNILNNSGNVVLIGGSSTSNIATFDLNGTAQTINGLVATAGTPANAIVQSSTGDGTLIAGNNNASSTFSGILQNGGGTLTLTKIGNGTLTLMGNNTYTGDTLVNAGTLALSGMGSISNTPTITLTAGATLDPSSRGDQTLTLVMGQVLRGSGTINDDLTVNPGGALAPGAATGAVGAFTVANAVRLHGTTLMKLNATAATNDLINANSLSYGGILTVTNVSGTLAAGQSFQLFSGNSYSGSFNVLNLPALSSGLMWENNLANNGSLQVVAKPQPHITGVALSGTNLILSGTNGIANGQYILLSSTNLTLSFSQWLPVLTNNFDGNGDFIFTNAVNSSVPQNFYLLQLQ